MINMMKVHIERDNNQPILLVAIPLRGSGALIQKYEYVLYENGRTPMVLLKGEVTERIESGEFSVLLKIMKDIEKNRDEFGKIKEIGIPACHLT